ncbi:uncharacterized protein LY89DRAFT_664601 [Mollisia scopiformis]|uniref:BTB domain-containing protein n=1 Tax=Mollisia scopiformis TaxID=149040 RepID=A0A194XRA0_MOLSC|nr:uncharacterized protein LY89DRAFT_664601 [Mollisia scopiformis]KUJ22815.1 hypothetical protein LY89DRAFT_664601 [Mollisia scopiformis]
MAGKPKTEQVAKRKDTEDSTGPRKKHRKSASTFSKPAIFVTFLIGPDRSEFVVHKEVVFNRSQVLAAVFSSDCIEGQTQTMTIEDTTEAAFRFVVQWLYSEKLEIAQLEAWKDKVAKDTKFLTEAEQMIAIEEDQVLAETWVLADKYGLSGLQNLVVGYMTDILKCTCIPSTRTFKYIYQHTSDDSQLRKACIISLPISML